ncbi:MAG: glutathione S-transferase family protein [Burkholderiales bacterium]|nr:glutathione S-transferase family protein [Burkholderiales bacterium]
MLRIWGRNNSVNVQKPLWCLEELSVPYERIDAGLNFGVVNSAEYRQLNPNGLVPTLEEDGFVLWESNAIVRYLAAKFGAGVLWPEDLRERAEADRWMDWQTTTFWPSIRTAFMGLVRTPPEKRDANAIEESRVKTAEALTVFDRHLQSRPYVAGNRFTMGDIPMGCAYWRWIALPIERPPLPNAQRWFESLQKRPAFAKVVPTPLS